MLGNWSTSSGTGITTYYSYLESYSSGTGEYWFGGDDREVPSNGRSVGTGQRITVSNNMTIKTFAFNFDPFPSPVTLVLNARNSATGNIIGTYTVETSSGGWVYWTGLKSLCS